MSVAEALEKIRRVNPSLNAFVDLTPGRRASGVPFAVKNLFDVAGLRTLAGSKINRDLPPATRDATAVRRLEARGFTLVGTLNMDEYALGYTTENTHYGPTRNPHDPGRIAGGSSGGSAAAVAAGLVPLALGSDTAGSIRVPAGFCGVWGLKPTYGRLSRAGTFPFCAALDVIGPLASSVEVLAQAYDAMQGPDPQDPVCTTRNSEFVTEILGKGIQGLRIARLRGYFEENAEPAVVELVKRAASALGAERTLEAPEAERASAATLLIIRSESGQLHLPNLRKRANDFDPRTRDRLLGAALTPAAWYVNAQRFRAWHHRALLKLFESVDVLLCPTTPAPAHEIGADEIVLRGKRVPARAAAGMLCSPWSLTGVPVISAPIGKIDGLPVGMQIVAAPWREDLCFRVARELVGRTGIEPVAPAV